MHPFAIIFIGFLFSLMGVVLPFLMVIHQLPSTFFLNFFAAGSMIVGLALGIGGASQYVRRQRK